MMDSVTVEEQVLTGDVIALPLSRCRRASVATETEFGKEAGRNVLFGQR